MRNNSYAEMRIKDSVGIEMSRDFHPSRSTFALSSHFLFSSISSRSRWAMSWVETVVCWKKIAWSLCRKEVGKKKGTQEKKPTYRLKPASVVPSDSDDEEERKKTYIKPLGFLCDTTANLSEKYHEKPLQLGFSNEKGSWRVANHWVVSKKKNL